MGLKHMIDTRVRGKHKKGCLAVKNVNNGNHSTAWISIDKTFVMTKKGTGREGPWFRMRCNDSDCEAKLLVRICDSPKNNGLESYLPRW